MTYALVVYPLSNSYRACLERKVGSIDEYIVLGELGRLSAREMLGRLRSIRADRVVVPLEEDEAYGFRSSLILIASLTRVRDIVGVRADGRTFSISRWNVIPSLAEVVVSSAMCRWSALRWRAELKEIADSRRDKMGDNVGRAMVYLKTDLWFGVEAGGSVGHVAGVINGFSRKGFHVKVLAPTNVKMLDPAVVSYKMRTASALGLPYELNYYRFQQMFVRQSLEILRGQSLGFLYQRMSACNYSGAVLSRRLRVPLVAEYNGSERWIAKHWRQPFRYEDLAEMAEDVMLRHAHLIVTVSDVLRDELIDRGVEPGRIVAYPNCIDPTIFDPSLFPAADLLALKSSLSLENDDVVVTFVGTFGKWHGATVFAWAIRHMVDADRDWLARHRVRFLLVGDGLEMPRVKEILGSERMGEFVRFAGLVPQAETPRYLAASDILVSPHVPNPDGSRFFGSPTKLFEYMAMAKGIVASDLEQLGQVLRSSLRISDLPSAGEPKGEKLAVLVGPDDEKELIEGIRFLVEHPEWRHYLGENARREVLARYTWDHHVNAILEGLHTVIG
jgi:glycosyltransferase involved in cell wall biosynthesis